MDSPVDVLVVGGGSIGERHLRCFQQAGGCRLALCESHDERRREVAQRYGVEALASVADAAARPWHAAVICTPAHLHVAHAEQLAPRTASLLIEKPLATKLDEATRLRSSLAGKTVRVAYVFRTHPAVQAVKQLLATGELGELLQLTIVGGQNFPAFRPAYREIYYADRATGGGAIQDAATHMFDLIQHLAGRIDWVFCDAAHQALEGVTVEDTVHVAARAGGGRVLVSLAQNQFMPPNELHVQLNGRRGTAKLLLHEHRWGVIRHGESSWTWSPPLVEERDALFRAQARQFLAACAGAADDLCRLDDALHTLGVNLAALESAGQRRIEIRAIGEAPALP